MRWSRRGRSTNLEDRRSAGPLRAGMPGIGLGGLLLLLAASWVLGVNPLTLLEGMDPGADVSLPGDPAVGSPGPLQTSAAEEELVDFVSFVLDDAQATWSQRLPQYADAKLVLFRGAVRSGCGNAEAAMGPFYCPADARVYVDLGFFEELRRRFGAPGDFAQAYVLAHEIGHHVQSQLGTERDLRRAQQADPDQANALSVRMELQADCYAGVWAHSTQRRDLLEAGDADEALAAAASVGDDRIQEMATGSVQPESFTHGSSEQRMAWFQRGFDSGNPRDCDTFGR
jgi:uncharacterized protein